MNNYAAGIFLLCSRFSLLLLASSMIRVSILTSRQPLSLTATIRRYIASRLDLRYLPSVACDCVTESRDRQFDRNWSVIVSLTRTVGTRTRSIPCPLDAFPYNHVVKVSRLVTIIRLAFGLPATCALYCVSIVTSPMSLATLSVLVVTS
jgi:hypothetical protein